MKMKQSRKAKAWSYPCSCGGKIYSYEGAVMSCKECRQAARLFWGDWIEEIKADRSP